LRCWNFADQIDCEYCGYFEEKFCSHWLLFPIDYSAGGNIEMSYYKSSFEVSKKQVQVQMQNDQMPKVIDMIVGYMIQHHHQSLIALAKGGCYKEAVDTRSFDYKLTEDDWEKNAHCRNN